MTYSQLDWVDQEYEGPTERNPGNESEAEGTLLLLEHCLGILSDWDVDSRVPSDDLGRHPEQWTREEILEEKTLVGEWHREMLAKQLSMDLERRLEGIENGEDLQNQYLGEGNLALRIKKSFFRAKRRGFRQGVYATVTVDPNRHASFEEMFESLNSELDNLAKKIKRAGDFTGGGTRPEFVSVIEVTNKGVPHAHIVYFGASWEDVDLTEEEVAEYWDNKRDVGEQVELRTMWMDGRRYQWVLPSGVSAASYFSELPNLISDIVDGASPYEKTVSGEDHWKLAMLWASDEVSQIVRRSQSLSSVVRSDVVDDSVPDSVEAEEQYGYCQGIIEHDHSQNHYFGVSLGHTVSRLASGVSAWAQATILSAMLMLKSLVMRE